MADLRERWFGPDSGDRYRLVLVVLLSAAGTPIVVYEVMRRVDDLVTAVALAFGAMLLSLSAVTAWHLAKAWLPGASAAYLAVLVAFTGGRESHLAIMFVLVALASAFLHSNRWFAVNLAWVVALALLPFVYEREGASLGDSEEVLVTLLILLTSVIVVHVLSVVLQARNQRLHAVLAEQRAAIEQLREAQDAKDLFLSALSHELRTPLTSIMGIGQTIQEHDDELGPERRQDLVKRLVANGMRLQRLLTDLLDLRRLQEGATELGLSPVYLPDLVAAALADVDRRLCEVRTDVPPLTVNLDVSKAERIIVNLVSNACKHTPEGSSVWVRINLEQDVLHLAVEDDGHGVPDHLKLSVFEPFRQGPRSRDDPSPGTGVGLSIVDRFARLHGGTAWVEDRPGGGAVFHVRLAVHETRRTRSSTASLVRPPWHSGERQGRSGSTRPQRAD